jgi:hypothetical protein
MSSTEHTARVVAEAHAFALITWPAAALAAHFAAGGEDGWTIAAGAWLVLFHAIAYRRGVAFGNLMLLLSGTVAWGSTAYPSSWVFAAFPLLLIGLHGAERALLRRAAATADGSPGEGASAAPIR